MGILNRFMKVRVRKAYGRAQNQETEAGYSAGGCCFHMGTSDIGHSVVECYVGVPGDLEGYIGAL